MAVAVEGTMGHDEVAANLAAYAAGTLEGELARAVQAHLTTGCRTCVLAVFDAPVGRPRSASPGTTEPASAWARPAVLVLMTVVGIAAGLVGRERQLRVRSVAERLDRLREAAQIEEDLRDRLLVAKAVLRSQRRVANAEQAVLARGADEAVQQAAALREELRMRQQQLAALETEAAGGRLANEVIAGQGLELRALRPAPPFRSVRGHVLWRPTDGEMVVYAFGLPTVPSGTDYEARVIVGEGRVLSSRLRRHPGGRAFAYLALPRDGSVVHAVEVRRVSDARRLLIADANP